MSRRKTIEGGVIASAVTPRRARESSIDLAGTLELIDFLCDGGVDAIELLGPVGDPSHFALEDRARMLDYAVKRSRAPVLVNVSHPTLDGTVFLAQEAAESGVAGVLILPPWDVSYDSEALRAYEGAVREEIGPETPVFPPDAFARADGEFRSLVEAEAPGCFSVVAGMVPELTARLSRAVVEGDRRRADLLESRMGELLARMEGWPAAAAAKEALRRRRLQPGPGAIPLGEAADRELARFGQWFAGWLPVVLKELR